MVTLYTSPSCTSCRKARAWLEENNITGVKFNNEIQVVFNSG